MNDNVTQAHRVAFRAFGIPLAHVRTTAAAIKELDGIRWRLRGRCASDKSGAWFMDPRTPAARTARSVCASCPVRARCLSAALLYGEEYGIWGGLDPEERSCSRWPPAARRDAACSRHVHSRCARDGGSR